MPPHRLLKTIDLFQKKHEIDGAYVDQLWKEFGASVRVARRDKKIGLKSFSTSLGCSRAFVGFLESGKRQWNFNMARKAVKILSK